VGEHELKYPREAYRLAWGWTLDHAAVRFNEGAAGAGADPEERVSLTGSRLREYEQWPGSMRKPSAEVLVALMESRGVSVAGTARRVSCSPGTCPT
jgi:hypothetical protein